MLKWFESFRRKWNSDSGKKRTNDDYFRVADTIESFLDGTCGNWDWDDYLHTRFGDPYMIQLQRRMESLSNEFPAQETGHYCNPDGAIVMREAVADLGRLAVAVGGGGNQ